MMTLILRIFSSIALLLCLPSFAHEGHPSERCTRWFLDTNISPNSKTCMPFCTAASVGMGTFNCPNQCDHFCVPQKAKICNDAPTLREYREFREDEGQSYLDWTDNMWDPLSRMRDGIIDNNRANPGIPASTIWNNREAIQDIVEGNTLAGSVDLWANTALVLLPEEHATDLKNSVELMITGMESLRQDNDPTTFHQGEDGFMRAQAKYALSQSGCSSDLTNDYNLRPYTPNRE